MFDSFQPIKPALEKIRNGVLISSEPGTALPYGLNVVWERGTAFVEAGTQVYEGMIIGLNTRKDDIEINVTKEKSKPTFALVMLILLLFFHQLLK